MKTITLNNGVKIPIIGYGTYKVKEQAECEKCVEQAINCGYRLIDTAQAYGNEEFVGNAIINSGIKREELFITTKIWFNNFEGNDAYDSAIKSIEKLRVDYVDMILIHWPYGNYYNAYRALEKLYDQKLVRAIGVSNFNPDRFIDLIKFNKIAPMVNQIETNLYCQRDEERKYLNKYGIAHQSYAPLGQGKQLEMFNEPLVLKLANKYGKTSAQILLKHLIEKDVIVIPKSSNEERIKENINVFDFNLTVDEINALNALNKNAPTGGKPETAERTEQAMSWV